MAHLVISAIWEAEADSWQVPGHSGQFNNLTRTYFKKKLQRALDKAQCEGPGFSNAKQKQYDNNKRQTKTRNQCKEITINHTDSSGFLPNPLSSKHFGLIWASSGFPDNYQLVFNLRSAGNKQGQKCSPTLKPSLSIHPHFSLQCSALQAAIYQKICSLTFESSDHAPIFCSG